MAKVGMEQRSNPLAVPTQLGTEVFNTTSAFQLSNRESIKRGWVKANTKIPVATEVKQIIEDSGYDLKSKSLHEFKFFTAVIEGRCEVVKKVFEALDATKSKAKKDRLISNNKQDNDNSNVNTKFALVILIIHLWLFILNSILTPVFYMFHYMTCRIGGLKVSEKDFISKFSRLNKPIMFAVLSGSEEMVKIFLENGASLKSKDWYSNNVLHFIADLSGYNLEHAYKCYNMLKRISDETNYLDVLDIKEMFVSSNKDALSPIDLAFKVGNVNMALLMIDDAAPESPLEETKTNVQDRACQIKDTEKICEWKVSWSYHLYSRRLDDFTEEDLHSIDKSMLKPDHLYSSQFIFILVRICFDILVTYVMIRYMINALYSPNTTMFVNSHVQAYLSKWSNDIFFDSSEASYQTAFFTEYPNLIGDLRSGSVIMDYKELNTLMSTISDTGYNATEYNNTVYNLDSFYERVCGNETFTVKLLIGDIKVDNCTIMAAEALFPVCREEGSRYGQLFHKYEYDKYQFAIENSFMNVRFNKNNSNIFVILVALYFILYILLDMGYRCKILGELFYNFHNFPSKFSLNHFFLLFPGSYALFQCKIFVSFAYLVAVFMNTDIFFNFKSYVDRGITDDILEYNRRRNDYTDKNNRFIGAIIVLICVCEFLRYFYYLIYVPWIRQFVILTFYMSGDLLKFMAIYIMAIVFLSIPFQILSRNEECPAWVDAKYDEIWDYFYSTFLLSLTVDSDTYFSVFTLRVAYLAVAIITHIVLLTVIIAVMTTTATRVADEPWSSHIKDSWIAQEEIGLIHFFTIIGVVKVIVKLKERFKNLTSVVTGVIVIVMILVAMTMVIYNAVTNQSQSNPDVNVTDTSQT